jgi:asparagine synthetase B (glutamine-hydrolysing)
LPGARRGRETIFPRLSATGALLSSVSSHAPSHEFIMSDINKVVLAYSGGLDTSVILKWLQDNYSAEVVTFTADIGQGEELEPARKKAIQLGIKPENI